MLEEKVFKFPEPVKTGFGKQNKYKLNVNKRRSFSPYANSARFAFKELSPNISPIPNPKDIKKCKPFNPTDINSGKRANIFPNVVFRTPPATNKKGSNTTIDMDRRISMETILMDIGMEKYINVFEKEEVSYSIGFVL